MPVLMPLSLAAGALLMVSIQETGLMSTTPQVLTRAVDREAHLRVTVPEASVLEEPHRKAEVVAVVRRGTIVEIAGEERDWYKVKLSDDRSGWVERDAFE
jgi:SH3-like domain-containing protein